MDCTFCSIVAKNDPHHEIVWEDDAHIAFLDIRPTAPGHVLVIPRTHIDYAFDMPADAFGALMETSRKAAIPLKQFTGAERIALAIDGFHVPHVHVHLVPAHKSGDICIAPQDATAEELRDMGDKLRGVYANLV